MFCLLGCCLFFLFLGLGTQHTATNPSGDPPGERTYPLIIKYVDLENRSLISDVPIKTSIYRGFSSQPCLMTPERVVKFTKVLLYNVFFTRHQQRQLSVSQPIYCFGSSKWQMFRYNLRMYICNIYIYTYTYIYIYVYIYICLYGITPSKTGKRL